MPTTTHLSVSAITATRPGICEECGEETRLTFASGFLTCVDCEEPAEEEPTVTTVTACHFCGDRITEDESGAWVRTLTDGTTERMCGESPTRVDGHRPWEPTRLPEHLTPEDFYSEEEEPTAARVLHLGIVRTWGPTPPPACKIVVDRVGRTVGTEGDSFKVWGNTEDPDEDHTDDGTRHIVVCFAEGKAPASRLAEEDAARTFHAALTAHAARYGWRVADYAVWSDEAWSENQHTVTCL